MKRLAILIFALALCAIAAAQSFPLSGQFIYAPKVRHTIAAVSTPVGAVQPITLGRQVIHLNAFMYAGSDLSSAKGAAGFGLGMDKDLGGLVLSFGATYGTVVDSSPHFGFSVGLKLKLSPPATAETHSFVIK